MKPAWLTPAPGAVTLAASAVPLGSAAQHEDDTVATVHPNEEAPAGKRIALGRAMADYGVSLLTLAKRTGLSKTAMHRLTDNTWPARTEPDALRRAVQECLREAGAPDAVLAVLWREAGHYRRALGAPTRDCRGRPTDAPLTPVEPDPYESQKLNERKAREMLLAKQTLGYEARQAFELFTNPFDGEVTTLDELYQNGYLRFVRECMWQAAKCARMVVVTGESGAGKTTLLADLEERIERDRSPVTVIRPSVIGMTETDKQGRMLRAADIVAAIILTLDPGATLPVSAEARSRKMRRMIEESAKVGNDHLLVIEEAHAIPDRTATALKRLHEVCRVGRKPALGILLLGHPELLHKLSERRADMREVAQRFEVVKLPPLDADLRPYLEHRCKAIGRPLSAFIDERGLEALRARLTVSSVDRKAAPISLVYPLAINNLMTAALNMAATLGSPLVTADVVRAL